MTRRQAGIIADIFSGAVAVSIAIALAGLTWRLVLLLSHRPAQVGAAGPPPALPFTVDVGPIVRLAPFGDALGGPLQPTTLPLELRGVLLTAPAGESSALIVANGGAVLPYKIGQPVPGGAEIDVMMMDRVILRVGDHRELLTFPKAAVPGSPPVQTVGTAPPPAPVGPAPIAPSAGTTGSATTPESLLASFGATLVDGGYRVGDTASPSMRETGLLPGDVIDQVNGVSLGNPAMDRQVLAAAARSGTVRIELVRNKRRMTLTVPLH